MYSKRSIYDRIKVIGIVDGPSEEVQFLLIERNDNYLFVAKCLDTGASLNIEER
jgi:hypothetical protein